MATALGRWAVAVGAGGLGAVKSTVRPGASEADGRHAGRGLKRFRIRGIAPERGRVTAEGECGRSAYCGCGGRRRWCDGWRLSVNGFGMTGGGEVCAPLR